jgi:hypothetical protein
MLKNEYSLTEIQKAFWETFHKCGEIWFDYLGSDVECEKSTWGEFGEFLENLVGPDYHRIWGTEEKS